MSILLKPYIYPSKILVFIFFFPITTCNHETGFIKLKYYFLTINDRNKNGLQIRELSKAGKIYVIEMLIM